jgi:DNA repair photolyase
MADALPIAQHESWISLDPVQGCPAQCVYCYLGPQELLHQEPHILESPRVVYQKLVESPFFDKQRSFIKTTESRRPICVGNYTDMGLTPANRGYLLELLSEHQRVLPDLPVCIVTKGVLSETFLEQVDQLNIRVILCISLSFLPHELEKGTSPAEERLKNFARIAQCDHIRAIHFWRPILSLETDIGFDPLSHIETLLDAGAKVSVVTGLKYGKRLATSFRREDHPLHDYFVNHAVKTSIQDEIFAPEVKQGIFDAARQMNYPVYLHTSCAVSLVLGQPDYNATFRKPHLNSRCLASHCPESQRTRCFDFAGRVSHPDQHTLQAVAAFLDIASELVSYSEDQEVIYVHCPLKQDDQTFLTQMTSFPVRGDKLIPTLEWIGSINRKESSDEHI